MLPDELVALDPLGSAALDPDNEPQQVPCSRCDAPQRWAWWDGRVLRDGAVRARWLRPRDPCERCVWLDAREAVAVEHQARMARAGVPHAHRGYSWDRVVLQKPGESWLEFARGVREHNQNGERPLVIGVAREDHETYRFLVDWTPGHGSLYLHGPPGAGKSLWLAAIVSDLVRSVDEDERLLDVDALVRRMRVPERVARRMVAGGRNVWRRPGGGQAWHPLVVDEDEVVARVSLAWSKDHDPLAEMAQAPVLVYDDFGTKLEVGGKAAELAATCIHRLVDYRWRQQGPGRPMPMLVSSNRTLNEAAGLLAKGGEWLARRTMDRLRELIGPRETALVGIPESLATAGTSWRNLPADGSPAHHAPVAVASPSARW